MKRKQVDYSQYQNLLDQDDNSNDGAYTEEEEHQHNKKAKTVVKRERDERFSSSDDSDDSDATASWSSATGRPGKDLPLRAMKQSVVNWIREAYTVSGGQGWTAKADIFEDYLSEWARMGREPQLTAPAFGRLVHKAFPGIKSCRMGPRVRARHCYKGLMRRDDASSSSSSTSSPSTTINSPALSPVSEVTSPLTEQQQEGQVYYHHFEQSEFSSPEQEYLDLESALESVEMLSEGTVNIKQEPVFDNDEISYQQTTAVESTQQFKVEDAGAGEAVSYADDMSGYHPYYYHYQQQPQQFCYPAAGQQLYYAPGATTTPDLDVGSTSSSASPSPTATPSPYEWSSFPAASTASLPVFATSFPAYTSSVSVPLPPCYYAPPATTIASPAEAYGYPSGGAAWAYPITTTGFGGFDASCASAAYTSIPAMPAPAAVEHQSSLSSSARSDILLSSFLSFDL